ncbi:MAG: TonB-dependent receptor domain-containing protein [Prolixibacteraceae bacterium]
MFSIAQIQITGYVVDSLTGERLIGANVFDKNTQKGTTTNAYGYFNISVQRNIKKELTFSFVGYTNFNLTFIPKRDTIINVHLAPGKEIDEITVSRGRKQELNEMSSTTISMKEVKLLPSLGGEHDLIKAIQLLPGVQSGNEASSGLYIRGGGPDQNLVMIDDVPLYYVNHLGGFVSIFNADVINNVKLIKGSFPARYGSRLSSVVDVRLKEGNMKKTSVTGSIGMVTMKAALEGPIKIDTSSYIISVRRFMYDLFLRPGSKIINEFSSFGYTFYDINAKYNHVFSTRDRIFFSLYNGKDKSLIKVKMKKEDYKSQNTIQWGNFATSVRWNHVFTPNLFSNLTAYYTQYFYNLNEVYQLDSTATEGSYSQEKSFTSGIKDFSLKLDFHHTVFPWYTLDYGAGIIAHQFTPTSTMIDINSVFGNSSEQYGDNDIKAFESFAYLENHIAIAENLNLNAGGRYSMYKVGDEIFKNFEPRIVLGLMLNNGNTFKIGYTEMNQYIHLLSSSATGIPADYWLPATSNLKPSNAKQIGFSFEKDMPGGVYSWSIEPYYKEMSSLIEFKQGYARLSSSDSWENNIEANGRGKSYGIELFVQKMEGLYTGYIGYTLSHTNRQFLNLNKGNPFPFKYNRLHDVSIVIMRKVSENIDFSATWVFGTGNAFTLSEGKYIMITNQDYLSTAEIYGEKNAFRLKPYHRLDIGINMKKITPWGERTWSFSIYNVYNRKNPYFYFWDTAEEDKDGLQLFQFSYFPIIPSVSYSFKF